MEAYNCGKCGCELIASLLYDSGEMCYPCLEKAYQRSKKKVAKWKGRTRVCDAGWLVKTKECEELQGQVSTLKADLKRNADTYVTNEAVLITKSNLIEKERDSLSTQIKEAVEHEIEWRKAVGHWQESNALIRAERDGVQQAYTDLEICNAHLSTELKECREQVKELLKGEEEDDTPTGAWKCVECGYTWAGFVHVCPKCNVDYPLDIRSDVPQAD